MEQGAFSAERAFWAYSAESSEKVPDGFSGKSLLQKALTAGFDGGRNRSRPVVVPE
jgi:hypothetical protein